MSDNQFSQEETVDIKAIFLKYSQYWYFFTLSVVICLFLAFLYNRYTPPTYGASTSILIRDDNNTSLGAENLLEGLELFSGKKNIENEIGILQSYDITKETLKKLYFNISYFHVGQIRAAEIYRQKPFVVTIDSTHLQTLKVPYKIVFISNDEFELYVETNESKQFLPSEDKYLEHTLVSFEYENTHKFNETIEFDNFNFLISKTDYFDDELIGEEYYFVMHDLEVLAKKRIKNLNINPLNKNASIIVLKSKGHVSRKEIDFLNMLSKEYIQLGLDEKNLMASNTIEFINKQLVAITDSLQDAEKELKSFKESNPKLELSYQDYGTFFQIEKLEQEKGVFIINDRYYEALLEYLQKHDNLDNIIAPSAMGINDALLNNLINELASLYSEQSVLMLNTKEKHPLYLTLQSKIENTKKSLIENIQNIINSSKISLDEIEKQIENQERSISNLPESERVLLNIQRKFNLNESIYTYLLEKRAEAAIAKAGNIPDHKVLNSARLVQDDPISPKKNIIYLISVIIGLLTPIISIIIKDFFNDKIVNKSDIEKITLLPIIGRILHSDKGSNLVVLNNPKSAISEAFRSVRTNIQYLSSEKENKIITITSSISGEGKTYCSMNLASVFALSGTKTLLIGADMRKPKIFSDFKLQNNKGLSNYLSNQSTKEEIIQSSNLENLDIILSGPTPPNPSELLDKKMMNSFLKELQKDYKYIIIDTPPIGLVTDGLILMKHADVNLYIIRQNYSKKGMLEHVTALFEQKDLKHINLIVNDIDENSMQYGYGYSYGYGYGYGYGYYDEDNEKEKSFFKKLFK